MVGRIVFVQIEQIQLAKSKILKVFGQILPYIVDINCVHTSSQSSINCDCIRFNHMLLIPSIRFGMT